MLAAGQPAVTGADLRSSAQAGLAVYGSVARPTMVEHGGYVLALAGHPRLQHGGLRSSDPRELLKALRERGKDALADVSGDFALAGWDGSTKRGLLAIDRFGVHQICYARAGDSLVFASSLDLLRGYPGIQRGCSPQGIYDYLFQHVCPGPDTVFVDLRRLLPGQCIEFGVRGGADPSAYWTLRYTEDDRRSFPELKEEFVTLLGAAVGEAAAGATTGAFLSGGTDSSTVSGVLSRVREGPAQTFSIGFDAAGYDEMAYARIAARHFGCRHYEYYVTPHDVVEAVPKIAAAYDQPFGNASAIPAYYCARAAREHGIDRLLAGDGGDELFGGNERYGKQYLLSLYGSMPDALRRAVVEPLLLARSGVQRFPLLRKLRSYVEQARPPMPLRYAAYNLLKHLGVTTVFTADFLASVDTLHPLRLLTEVHTPHAGASLINQMQAVDLRFVLADGDLPKVTRTCALADVDVAFPLLDDRVFAFAQHLPSDLKLRGRTLRWFFKRALSDFLPIEVIRKQKHGFGLPVGVWLVEHQPLADLAAHGISLLRDRGIVQQRFIDEVLPARMREHRAYFGTMMWVLMMLGLWLDSRKL